LEKVDCFNRAHALEKGKKLKVTPDGGEKKRRAAILKQAVEKARPSAEIRMRKVALQFQEGEIELMECPVCLEPVGEVEVALTPCGHPFCAECVLNALHSASSTREAQGHCPQCREKIDRSELVFLGDASDAGQRALTHADEREETPPKDAEAVFCNVSGFKMTVKEETVTVSESTTQRVGSKNLTEEERREQRACLSTLSPDFLDACGSATTTIGTKVSRLLEEIQTMFLNSATSKCVVFSQFLGVLDIAATELQARGILFVRVDGNKKQYERADALIDFSSDPNIKVFLLSMRAVAVGLNLTAADHCFIMDVAQNAAVEEQAIDRIHRIGQCRPVTVKRFVIKGTVEERILTSRRSLVSDRPVVSTTLDVTSGKACTP
jgi:DNA repair protein RAD5